MQNHSTFHPGTRFLALSAIALTAISGPLRADDWASVRADGQVTRGNAPTQSTNRPERDNTYDGPNAYSTNNDDNVRHLRPDNNRNRRNNRRYQNSSSSYAVTPNYGAYPNYNTGYGNYGNGGYAYGAPNYGTQTYGYGAPVYGYYPPVNQTIVVPPVAYSGPIGGPPPFPWVKSPWITSIPVGGTVITTPGYPVPCPAPNYVAPGYTVPAQPYTPGVPYWAHTGTPYWAIPTTQTNTNGVYGSVTFGGHNSSVTIGGYGQNTQTYNGYGTYYSQRRR